MKTITSLEVAERLDRGHNNLRRSIKVWFRDEPNPPELVETQRNVGSLTIIKRHYILNLDHCKEILKHLKTEISQVKMQKIVNEICQSDSQPSQKRSNSGIEPHSCAGADTSQQPEIFCIMKQEYGEMHYAFSDGKKWYCVTDVCRCLSLLLREGESILKRNSHQLREYIFRRRKIAMSYVFTDTDGLLSIIIESRKIKANGFRMWIEREVVEPISVSDKTEAPVPVMLEEHRQLKEQLLIDAPEKWDEAGPHPTIDEYFSRYVPVETFCAVILQLCITCLAHSKTMPHDTPHDILALNDILNKVYIMRTFHDALRYNFSKQQ